MAVVLAFTPLMTAVVAVLLSIFATVESLDVHVASVNVYVVVSVIVESGSTLDKEMIASFPQMLPELAFRSYIRKNIDVKKAPLALQPLCFFSPRCAATADYAALCDEMLERIEG